MKKNTKYCIQKYTAKNPGVPMFGEWEILYPDIDTEEAALDELNEHLCMMFEADLKVDISSYRIVRQVEE